MTEPWTLDATAQAELIRSGALSSEELTRMVLARIEVADGRIGAVVGLDAERALAQAGVPRAGRFGSVPFLVKDLLPQTGLRCAFGSRLFRDFVPPEASPYAQAIDDAGLVTLGKTTSSEFGLLGSTETLLDGSTRNPWSLEHSAGGSSGGAAAAVAAGFVPMAHASDGGGSIRLPASLCGLFGFKPSRERCLPALPPSDLPELTIDHVVTRTVRDSAGFLAVTERPNTPWGAVGFVAPATCGPLRIGVYTDSLMGRPATRDGATAVEHAANLCASLGHHVEVIEPPPPVGRDVSEAFFTIAAESVLRILGMVAAMRGRPVEDDELEPFTGSLLRWYRAAPAGALQRALDLVERTTATMTTFLAGWDVTLCPTSGVDGPPLGFLAPNLSREVLIERTEQLAGYTPAHNMVGAPAMSVPLWVSPSGLPVGCHFAASPGHDARLLELAYQLEEADPWEPRLLRCFADR
jgi:amidase